MRKRKQVHKCTGKCKEVYPNTVEYFDKDSKGRFSADGKDKLRPVCKTCNKEKASSWNLKNGAKRSKIQKKYQRNNIEVYTMNAAKRRAILLGATVENFTRQSVLDKWGTDCHICKKPIDVLDWHMEHVVPLSKGGEHSLSNVKPSHPTCNLKKGASYVS